MQIENRCVSGLHILPRPGFCVHCRKIRNVIWNSDDPLAMQKNFNLKCESALAEAAKFNIRREYLQREADLAQMLEAEKKCVARVKAKQEEQISIRRARSHNMRAKRIRAEGFLSHDLLDRLYKLQNGKCPCCKRPLGKDFHMDHIEPLSKGGSNTDDNIQLLRSRCNLIKSAMDPIIFMQINGYLL